MLFETLQSPRDKHNEQPDRDRKGMEKFQCAVTEEPAAQRQSHTLP